MPANANGQVIYVTNVGNGNNAGTIGEYDATTGATINASLVTGLDGPIGIAISGSDIFVLNNYSNTIGEYTTSGATVNAALVSGLHSPAGIAVSGSDIFVTYEIGGFGGISEYTTSGATVNATLISGINGPAGFAVSGSDIFVANPSGPIGEYTTSGATVNAALVSDLNGPSSLAVSGSSLFVENPNPGTIGVYDSTTGATVNADLISGVGGSDSHIAVSPDGSFIFITNYGNGFSTGSISEYTTSGGTLNVSLITGLNSPWGIAVVPIAMVPEPSTWALLAGGVAALVAVLRRRKSRVA